VLLERAMIFQRQRDYRRACKELHEAVKYDTTNHQVSFGMRLLEDV
jgi:hypothetical protein